MNSEFSHESQVGVFVKPLERQTIAFGIIMIFVMLMCMVLFFSFRWSEQFQEGIVRAYSVNDINWGAACGGPANVPCASGYTCQVSATSSSASNGVGTCQMEM